MVVADDDNKSKVAGATAAAIVFELVVVGVVEVAAIAAATVAVLVAYVGVDIEAVAAAAACVYIAAGIQDVLVDYKADSVLDTAIDIAVYTESEDGRVV